jgi:hypothetical protein
VRAVGRKREEILVWIDALCIDQQNKDEQASQVCLMGHVYSQAKSVAIWLGPKSDESDLAVRLVRRVSENAVAPQSIRAGSTYRDSSALLTLFKREYWKPLWVVQEIFNARRKMVYCGDSVLLWEVYKQTSDAFWDDESNVTSDKAQVTLAFASWRPVPIGSHACVPKETEREPTR